MDFEQAEKDLDAVIQNLKQASDKEVCLRRAYDVLTAKYRGYRLKTYTNLSDLFVRDPRKLWERSGFLHCTKLNQLMKFLLVQSGQFTSEDIQIKWTAVWYVSPHQYLMVDVGNNRFINVDLWGKAYGIFFGDYARGFH